MLKKAMLFLLLTSVIFMSSCTKETEVDPETLEDILDALSIQTQLIMANHIYEENGYAIDHIEMIDQSQSDSIFMHIIISSDNIAINRDDMILITPGWIYTTRNMRKVEHSVNLEDAIARQNLIEIHTTILDFDFLTLDALYDLGHALIEPKLSKVSQQYTLKGQVLTDEQLEDDQVKVAEIVYENNWITGIHVKYEYTFRSTYQKSNYISGMHYFFGEEMFGEFPSLDQFTTF